MPVLIKGTNLYKYMLLNRQDNCFCWKRDEEKHKLNEKAPQKFWTL